MRRLLSLLRELFRRTKPTPVYVAPAVACVHGVNTHRNSIGELDGVQALGARYLRATYYTKETSEVNASWAWKLPAMDARGIEPLIVVHDMADANEAVVVMAGLTREYPGRTWQVGNEWDWFFPGFWCRTGDQYAALMRRVVAACPVGTRFVGMGLATYGTDDLTRQPEFLRSYLAAGGPTLSAWCLHTYGTPLLAAMREKVAATHAVLRGAMPLWITEYGVDSPDDAYVCDQITQATVNAGSLGVSRTYQYCYWDNTLFGLVRDDESHRPAWDVLHRFIATLVVAYPLAGL